MSRKKKDQTITADSPHGDHVEFGRDQLREALAVLKPVLYKRASRKDCASYHFTVKPGERVVTIAATDLVVRVQLRVVPLAIVGSGTVMVDAHALNMMLDTWAEPRLRLHLAGPNPDLVELSWFSSTVKVNAYDPAKELNATAEPSLATSGFLVDAGALSLALSRVTFATDAKATRYALGGVAFDLPEADEPANLVATDGRRLARVKLEAARVGEPEVRTRPLGEFSRPSDGLPVIPLKAIGLIEKLARREATGRVAISILHGDPLDLERETFGPARAQFAVKDAVLTVTPMEGRFPQYEDVFPGGPPTASARLENALRLTQLLAMAAAATGTESKGVEVTMAGGCIMLSSESAEKGSAQLSLTGLEMDGRGTVTLDALMFRQMLDVVGDDPLTIEFFGPKDPVLVRSSGHWEGVQMPLTRDRSGGQDYPAAATTDGLDAEATAAIQAGPMADDLDPRNGEDEDEDVDHGDDGGDVPEEPRWSPPTVDSSEFIDNTREAYAMSLDVPEATDPATVDANGHAEPAPPKRKRKK